MSRSHLTKLNAIVVISFRKHFVFCRVMRFSIDTNPRACDEIASKSADASQFYFKRFRMMHGKTVSGVHISFFFIFWFICLRVREKKTLLWSSYSANELSSLCRIKKQRNIGERNAKSKEKKKKIVNWRNFWRLPSSHRVHSIASCFVRFCFVHLFVFLKIVSVIYLQRKLNSYAPQ